MTEPSIGIFGAHSYIGSHFVEYIGQYSNSVTICINSRTSAWETKNFGQYDVILHVAGIAHVSTDPKMKAQYYAINRDLPIAVAQKAKKENVKQFIFLSSMIVYGDERKIECVQRITQETVPTPLNFYGKSKLEAEDAILSLQSSSFTVSVLRLPMVYGPECKGNFSRLISLASCTPLFPNIENMRSMIYIENLCEYLRLCIRDRYSGILFPQNLEYVSTRAIVDCVTKYTGHRPHYTAVFNPLLRFLSPHVPSILKVFGSKVYDKTLSPDIEAYNKYSFEESMERYFGLSKNERGKVFGDRL